MRRLFGSIALLASAGASAAPPATLDCTVVKTWACPEGERCAAVGSEDGERYRFDLTALTFDGPNDRGAITDLETDDRGFMTFVLGDERRYVHKNVDGDADDAAMTSFLYLSPKDMRELRCAVRRMTKAEVEADARRGLAGHYYLSGVTETGSELLLRPDGRFGWFMSYGAVDQQAEGRWRIEGDAVVLTAEGAAPAFRELRLPIDGRALVLNGSAKGRYERRP